MRRGIRLVCTGPCGLWIAVEPEHMETPDQLHQVLLAHGWQLALATFGEGSEAWEELAVLCPECNTYGHTPIEYAEVPQLRADLARRLEALGRG